MTSGVDVEGECEKMCSLRGGKKGTASADVIKSRVWGKKKAKIKCVFNGSIMMDRQDKED